MKNFLLLAVLSFVFSFVEAQTTSVYHVETEYTPQNGYRYYFDKINPQTGASTRLAQLPVSGYFTGYAFFNCFGHYVFQGVDTVTYQGMNINKLYELDTLGNLIRTVSLDTATGTWYKMCWPASATPSYYALRWNINTSQWVLETINALTGTRTFVTLSALALYSFNSSDAAITRNDIVWMGMDDQMTSSSVLIGMNPLNGALILADTLLPNYHFNGLSYDCVADTVYGFISHMDSVNNSELFKVHGPSGNIVHTGRTAIGTGFFAAGSHTHLADGSFYMKTSNATYWLPDFNVTAPTFTLPSAPNSSLPAFCFAAPREACIHYVNCVEPTGINDSQSASGNSLYPNPVVGGELHIEQPGNFIVQMYDSRGSMVFSGESVNAIEIEVGNFSSGIYAVVIQQGAESTTQKLIISN